MRKLILPSYAKINIGLRILKKRPDGYHDLQTIFQMIDLHDTLTFESIPAGIELECSRPDIPLDETNLIIRAFRAFGRTAGECPGLRVHLEKTIPAGGGLGGGSSNAAVTLLAANAFRGNSLSFSELDKMAGQIGSDVPFFLHGGTAFGQGRGEILEPVKWSLHAWVVIVIPGIQVATAWAYGQVRIALTKEKIFTNLRALFTDCSPQALRDHAVNDFEGVVFERHPELREIKAELIQRDAFYASMTGSGSTLFGLFDNPEKAESAASFFSMETPWKALVCRPVETPFFGLPEPQEAIE